MKTLNVMLSNLGGRVVPIGYEGENLYTRIRINCIEVFSEYPDATVSMVVSPPDGEMYPAVVEKSGVMVIWDITDSVLSSNGSGECQLTFTEGDVVRKSVVFGISINRSLIASGEAPEPVQEWIDKAEQTAQEIAENAAMLAKQDIVESYGEIAPAIIETEEGEIASISDGADGMLVKTLTVEIDPVQEGSGDPSPENVRPISGWTEANVSRTGVNVWDEETKNGYYHTNGGTFTPYPGQLCSKNFIAVKPNTTYRFCKSFNLGDIFYYGVDKTYLSAEINRQANVTFTTPDNCYFININLGSSYGATYNHDASINYPSTDTQYHAYSGETIEYEFPQAAGTVYGGELTIHQDGSGELVVDRADVDLGTLNYTKANQYFYADAPSDSAPVIGNGQPFICEIYKRYVGALNSMPDFTAGLNNVAFSGIKVFYCKDSRFDNASDFKTAMSGVKLVYPLATPVTYQLTNQQVIALLKGSNNIWADTGDVALEYPADTKLYIDGKVAELQALILENISNS